LFNCPFKEAAFTLQVGDEYLELEQRYRLVTKAYLANGKDGYDALAAAAVIVDEECAPSLTSCVQNHFKVRAFCTL
jgi:5'-nucleotidase